MVTRRSERAGESVVLHLLFKVAGYQLMIFMTLASSYTVLAMGICAGGVAVRS